MSIKDRLIRLGQGHLHTEKIYGKSFEETYKFLEESQWWSKKKHEEYQLEKLKEVIKNAYENVPYYTNLFNEYGINAYKIEDFSDIKRIPYLTKEIIIENINDLYNIRYPKYKIEKKVTGGSTGVPMPLYQDRFYTRKVENAFVCHMWSRVGYDKNKRNRIVYLRGTHIKNEFEKDGNKLFLNSFLLNEDNFLKYIKYIDDFKPDFINGYPSVIYLLANYIIKNNIKIDIENLKSILLTSENYYDFQRSTIEKAFGRKTYTFYGHTERACIGGECERSNKYHIHSEYGYLELINKDGIESKIEGELSEIVCTGFINPVMPFIRYKTKDIAINTLEECSCGRHYKLLKGIEGRIQDFIFDSHENILTFTCQDEPLWNIREKLDAYQYVQSQKGKIVLNIMAKCIISSNELLKTKKNFSMIFKNIELDIRFVNNIERNSNGKFRYLIQNIKNEFFNY